MKAILITFFRSVFFIFCLLFATTSARAQNIIQTIAGNGTGGYIADGVPAISTEINGPSGIYVDGSGNIYFADYYNQRIRKIDPSGIITTVAGTGGTGYGGDGFAATNATLDHPVDLFVDASGNLIFTDYSNHAIRKVNPSGIISTICGKGISGFSGDGGPATAAKLNSPTALCGDATGNIYISDASNSRVRMINTGGIISTVAGNGLAGFFGDGSPATNAKIYDPFGLTVDASGNLYIADQNNNRVRMVNPSGIISTFAGSASSGFSGDGAAATMAQLNTPTGVSFDAAGNLYIADRINNCIRRVSSGIITTVAGVGGVSGFSGDGGPATTAKFNNVPSLRVSAGGIIYISDFNNNRIREMRPDRAPYFTGGINQTMIICENSGATTINSLLAVMDTDISQTETWTLSLSAKHGTPTVSYTTTSTGSILTPTGLSYTPTAGYSGTDSFMVSVTDGILADTITIYVTINPITAISGSMAVCTGQTTVMSDSTGGGTWSSTNTAVASIGISSGVVNGIAAGTSTITYTTGTGCTATNTVTVLPVPGAISGTATVCTGMSTTLSDASGGGTWSSPDLTVGIGSATGVVTGISTGTATITYTAGTGCRTTITATIYPLAAITGVTTICVSATTVLTDAVTGGTWSSNNTGIATVAGSGVVTGVATGTTTITYLLSTGCSATTVISVSLSPTVIFGASTVCSGLTTTLSDGVTGGTWSSSNTSIASIGSSSGVVNGIASGTSTITYTAGTGCTTTITATVYPLAAITGATTICVSATTALTDAVTGGTWSSSNTGVATVAGSGVVTGMATGTTTITYLLPTGCSATIVVLVSLSPTGIFGASTVCSGLTTTLTDGVTGGAWSSSNTAVATVSGGTVSGVTGGTATISYSLGTGCIVTKTMSVSPSPTAILGTRSLCSGTATTLSDASGGGTWSSSNTATTITGGGVLSGVSGGTATITYSTGCIATAMVTVIATPAAISGIKNVCAGMTTILSDATTGGTWSSPDLTVGIGTATGVVTGVAAGTATITYSTGTACVATAAVTVNPLAAITGSTTICVSATTALTDAATGGAWSSSNTGVATVAGTGIVTGMATGTATITYLLPTGCTATKIVTVSLSPMAISGGADVCVGQTITLSDAVTGGTWSSPDVTIGTGTATGIVTGISAGTAAITYSLGAGCIATEVVTVNALSSVTGGTAVCAGASIPLSDAVTGGAWSSSNTGVATVDGITGIVTGMALGTATIVYTLPTGCVASTTVTVSSSPTGIIGSMGICKGSTSTLTDAVGGGTWTSSNTSFATVGGSSGIITGINPGNATITYSLGSGCTVTGVATVYALPAAITGIASVCPSNTTALSNTTAGGTWSTVSGAANVDASLGIVTGITAGTAGITYTITGTGCDVVRTVTVNLLPLAITGSTNVCMGASIPLTDATMGGTWKSSPDATIDILSGLLTGATAGIANTTYTLNTGCASTTTITVNPAAGAITGIATVCAGATTNLFDGGGGTWTSSNTDVADIDISSGAVTTTLAGTAIITYTLPAGCAATAVVTVNASPGAITGSSNVCLGASIALSDASGGTWSGTGGGIVLVGTATGIVTGRALGTSTITYALPTGCVTTLSVTVNPLPAPITGGTNVCGSATITLSDTTAGGAWSSADGGIATVSASGVVTGEAGGVTSIIYTTAAGCTAITTVSVNPGAGPITGIRDMCAGGDRITAADIDTTGIWSSTFVTIMRSGVIVTYDTGVGTITYTLPDGCYATATLTVNPLPAVITGPVSVCTGQSIALTDSVPGGIWSSADITVTMGGGSGIATGLSAGTAIATYTISDGCSVTHKITVYELPSAIVGAASICVNAVTTLSDALVGGTWGGSSGIATISGAGLVTGMSAGTAVISYTGGGGCMVDRTVSVMPLPGVFGIMGGGSFCAGGTGVHVLLSGSSMGIGYKLYDGGSVTDSLTGSGGFLDFGAETTAGIYTVIAKNMLTGCSNIMSDSAIIIVNPALVPSVAIARTPADTVCAGTAVALTATPVNGGLSPMYQWKVNGVSVGTGSNAYSYTPSNGDVVVVTLTSDATCAMPSVADDFTIMNVETPVAPTVVITADPGMNISKGGSVTFTAVVTNGGATPAYEWLEDGTVVAGANSATLVVSDLTANETIVCEVTSSGLCSVQGSSNQAYISVNSTGVNSLTAEGELTVTPNPNNGSFIIKGSLGIPIAIGNDEEASLEITDMVGQVVYKNKVTAHNGIINERVQLNSGIANGMYQLNVRSGAETKVFHIVVEQ